MDIVSAIRCVTDKQDLSEDDMGAVMRGIMTGEATPAQIGGFLVGLRMKGESVDEITAAARVMRELATRVDVDVPNLVDTCGTGGDSTHTFNVSTASAFVAAGAGAHVAKHGNRSVSSSSGSADVLEEAGVRVDLSADKVARCIREVGLGFMFAPMHHGAMRHAIGPRREMGLRTIFNVLGPLTNPAGAAHQVVGVFSRDLIEPLARVLGQLGSKHVMVVHAEDGLDEISAGAATEVAEWKHGEFSRYRVEPQTFGINPTPSSELTVASAQESLALIRQIFAGSTDGQAQSARDIVVLNAGAALYVSGIATDLESGVARARESIDSGGAQARLEALAHLSTRLADDD